MPGPQRMAANGTAGRLPQEASHDPSCIRPVQSLITAMTGHDWVPLGVDSAPKPDSQVEGEAALTPTRIRAMTRAGRQSFLTRHPVQGKHPAAMVVLPAAGPAARGVIALAVTVLPLAVEAMPAEEAAGAHHRSMTGAPPGHSV